MADLSDVEQALLSLLGGIVYPDGYAGPPAPPPPASALGLQTAVELYRGWPQAAGLEKTLRAGWCVLSVFSLSGGSRDTSRYPRDWFQTLAGTPTLTVGVDGNVATFAGFATPGQVIGLQCLGIWFSAVLTAQDTPGSVALALALGMNAETQILAVPDAATVTVLSTTGDPLPLVAGVGAPGQSQRELRRQEQRICVTAWCPTPGLRDQLTSAVDAALAAIDFLPLADGTAARIRYVDTHESDAAGQAPLYRRDLTFVVEYATTQTQVTAPLVFPIGTLAVLAETVSITYGFGGLSLPAPLVIPPLGAIRFDAWYDPGNTIDVQAAAALSPAAYQFRLPANATIVDGAASWPLATQATLDAEIVAAKLAGLSFWAFDSYSPTDTLSLALQLYLSSALRGQIGFCMLGQSSNWADPTTQDGYSAAFDRDVGLLSQAGYQTVAGGRPLFFVLDASAAQLTALPSGGLGGAITALRNRAQAAGALDPYVVFLSGAALADFDNTARALQVGADAAGAYTTPRLNGSEQSFAALTAAATADWSARAARSMPMVPTAMTGWDQRPLIQTPQPFYPISSYLSLGNYYDTATAPAIAAHVTAMAEWIVAHPGPCPAQAGLIYAWNELAEGGWMMPTYTPAGPDLSRCGATGAALAAAVLASRAPKIPLLA